MTNAAAGFEQAAALHRSGDLKAAAEALSALAGGAAAEDGVRTEALRRLGAVQTEMKDYAGALRSFDQALAAAPGEAETHAWRAEALNWLERHEEAEKAAGAALRASGGRHAPARAHLALGIARLECGDVKGAHAPLNRALLHDPDSLTANFHRARLAVMLGDLSGAAVHYQRALDIDPDSAETLNNLGNVRRALGQLHKAETLFKRAARAAPDNAAVHVNHGVVLQELGDDDDAAQAYDRALKCEPGMAVARRNRALLLLKKGELHEGFKEYEWRWRTRTFRDVKPPVNAPLWDGGRLDGTLAFWSEQGAGDAVQFIRYAPLIKQRLGPEGRIAAVVPASLRRLFQSAPGVDEVTTPENPPRPAAAHLPMMSAPNQAGTTFYNMPAGCPYLAPTPEEREKWRGLTEKHEFNVGVVWSGDTRHVNDRRRSMSSEDMLPLAGVPGVRLYILQVGPAADEGGGLIREGAVRVGHRFEDFNSTAAVIEEMDLVISVDTAVAHLAGALNKPVWIAISAVQDWRWFEFLEDSPWYPSARLYRQRTRGDWPQVIAAAAEDLAELAAGHASKGAI